MKNSLPTINDDVALQNRILESKFDNKTIICYTAISINLGTNGSFYKEKNMILDRTEEFVKEAKKNLLNYEGTAVEKANAYATLAQVETLKQINETLKLLAQKEPK